jgi:hypothetical protein
MGFLSGYSDECGGVFILDSSSALIEEFACVCQSDVLDETTAFAPWRAG